VATEHDRQVDIDHGNPADPPAIAGAAVKRNQVTASAPCVQLVYGGAAFFILPQLSTIPQPRRLYSLTVALFF